MTDQTAADVGAYYASGAYHTDEHRHQHVVSYKSRYYDDRQTARIRLDTYRALAMGYLDQRHPCLDVGAANGAFVDELIAQGFTAMGVEPDPAFTRDNIGHGFIDRTAREHFGLVTYHDVLEHVADPRAELELAAPRLRPGGLLIVDVPDVHVDEGAKHFKREHLWYFTLRTLTDLVREVGLRVVTFDFPIPGKMVVYGCRPR